MPVTLPRWLYSPHGEGVIVTTPEEYEQYVAQGWALKAVDVGFGARGDAARVRQGIVQLVPEETQTQMRQMQGSLHEYTEELAIVQAAVETVEGRLTSLEGALPETRTQVQALVTNLQEQVNKLRGVLQEQERRLDQLETMARAVSEGEDTPSQERRRR